MGRRRVLAGTAALAVVVSLPVVAGPPATAADGWTESVIAAEVSRYGVAVDVDSAGNAVAMWAGPGDDYTLYGARRPAGGAWGEPIPLGEGYHFSPNSVALTAGGAAYFAYTDLASEGSDVGIWRTDDTLAGTRIGGRHVRTQVHSDPVDDDVVVVDTSELRGPGDWTLVRLVTAETPEGSWAATTGVNTFFPTVAFAGGHELAVGFATRSGQVRVVRVAGDGTRDLALARDPGCRRAPVGTVSLALDDAGRGTVAWRCAGDRASVRAVYLRRDSAGPTEVLARSRAGVDDSIVGPIVAASPGGQATLVWGVHRPAGYAVLSSSRGVRRDWGDRVLEVGGQSALTGFTAERATTGAAVVAWIAGDTVVALVRRAGEPFTLTEVAVGQEWASLKPGTTADGAARVVVGLDGADDPVSLWERP